MAVIERHHARTEEGSPMTATPPVILVVEDEEALRFTLGHNLTREGYRVVSVARGDDALAVSKDSPPDLVILDVMLPGVDGIQVCRQIRRRSTVPIIMLTALGGEGDKVAGLDAGADDYLPKPFGMRELLARVRAHLRRTTTTTAPNSAVVSGDIEADSNRREVRIAGRPVRLTPREFDLLVFLMKNAGRVLSREQIIRSVWGDDFAGTPRTVDVHVRWLRSKIEPDAGRPTRLVTVRGVGYRFEG
jgi:two-component system, OmpR family, response regulator